MPNENNNVVEVHGLSKSFGKHQVLRNVNFTIPRGHIYGLIGHNGAGKTTAINALLGLINYQGSVQVLGMEPYKFRDTLMQDVAFISDVASLPRFLKVSQFLDMMEDLHPNFSKEKANVFLNGTDIRPSVKIKALSKGMLAQLHLACVMAIDAKLLVLDEPTLGLDIIFRKKFYRRLLEDYMSEDRSILITTHQVDEIEFLLSDLIFIKEGEIVLDAAMEDVASRFSQVLVAPENLDQAKAANPISSHVQLGQNIMLFDGLSPEDAANLGEVSVPSVSDLFVALMERTPLNQGAE